MSKLHKLTKQQEEKIIEYREKYFTLATCTDPADRLRAEKAARDLAEIAGVKIKRVEWVENPQQGASLSDSLRASLRASLWASLWDSLWDSLSDSLRDSLWDSLSDLPWTCFYTYCVTELLIDCNAENKKLLLLHNEIAASCYAVWIVPGTIILCERPKKIKIKDGKLIDIKWRNK